MFAKVPDQQITKESVKETVECFAQHQMDIFDKELAKFCSDYKIKNIVTDDRDYHCAIKAVNIYTANRKYFTNS